MYSLTGRKDGGKEAFRERFERAIETAKFHAANNLFSEIINQKQSQWDMLSYLFDTTKEDQANADFSSNLLNSKYDPILKELIRVEKERENDSTIHMAGDTSNTEPVSISRRSAQVGGVAIPTPSRSLRSADRQDSRSDLSQSKSAADDNRGGIQPEKDRESSLPLYQQQDNFGANISEIPSIERSLGDDTLSSREGDDRALPRTESISVSDNGSIMPERLERNSENNREGLQRVLDTRGDGGVDSRSNTLTGSSNIRDTLSDYPRSNTSDRTRESREGGEDKSTDPESREQLSTLDFGTNYPEYYHNGKGAIEKLLQEKQGQVQGAFYKEGLGDIDLVWGEITNAEKHTGYGLAHIIDKHPEITPEKLNDNIINGKVILEPNQAPKIETDGFKIILKSNWFGKSRENKWIVTAYETRQREHQTLASDVDYIGKDNAPKTPSQLDSTTEELRNQPLNHKEISNRLSDRLRKFYDINEFTKTLEYQNETKTIPSDSPILSSYPKGELNPEQITYLTKHHPLRLKQYDNWVKKELGDPFGIKFIDSNEQSPKGIVAINRLLSFKLGQVKGAFYKEGLGDIDLVWGDSKMGLAHILARHPEVIEKIPEIIEKGIIDENNGAKRIEYNNARVGISKGWFGKGDNHWVVTAYDLEGDKKGSKSSSFSSDSEAPREIFLKTLEHNPTIEELKNQEISEEIKEDATELANKANPTADTQPYLPLVESVEKRVLQNKAEAKKEVIFNDLEDIKKDLPYLLKEQAEDVKFAEERFSTGARGVLFTNGTGTGKTFTGLGIAKRKVKMGAKNILILTQSTQKNIDWKKEGKILNMDITEVRDTKDNPNGVIIATYANFRDNAGLNSRTYDLIIYDESQSILGSKEGNLTSIFTQHQNISIWNYLEPNTPRSDENFHKANELAKNNQVVFLSATPFASHKALRYGEGLLFDRVDNDFFINNFGYSIKYSKLTYPQRGVDVGQLERDFADKLAKNGVSRGRRLMSDYDYNRAFMKVDGGLGKEIDGALDILFENGKKYEEQQYRDLYLHYRKKFNYHYVNKISESIKAKETLEFVKDNLKEGRKVVIFHSYNEGGVVHPFIENFDKQEQESLYNQYELFKKEHPQYFKEMNFENPLDLYKKEFGNRVDFYNGRVSKKNKSRALELFNDDNSGVDVLVVQIDAGGTGISLHDKTGLHPRVALKLNIPTKPITEIQSEGRVYRTGQKSNTAYVYPVTHLGIEQRVFGSSINERIGTVENLALGSEARNLKDTFKQGYLQAKTLNARTLEFTGGKDYDRALEKLEPYAKAINDYFSHKSNKFDGVDYFPTPEPIGYKMARWADVLDGESILEPSAGSGAIARYFSEGARASAIEPSSKLFSKLQVNISSENPRLLNKNFEDLNIREKFDGIVMNPPFGNNSVTAIAHLKKALSHLNSEGRVVALVPSGNSMMKHLEDLSEFTKDIKKSHGEDFKIVAEISLPSVTFKRAGTNVNTKILIIDKTKNEVVPENYDFSHIDKIEELFEELGNIDIAKRERIEKIAYDEPLSSLLHNGIMKADEKKLSVSMPLNNIERSRLNEIWKVAKDLKGMFVKGKFVFPDNESFRKFIESEDC